MAGKTATTAMARCRGRASRSASGLIRAADEMPQFSGLAALMKTAGRTAKCNILVQGQFFWI
jgi:hypothetical protein